MIGRAISHYKVVATLGSGGMGVVYLAEDERLGRQVALKFLPAESVSSRQALDRFRVEARAASSLSHPGICAIYDIGEESGAPYIVMEALKGESLRDRINRGPVKVADLLDVAIQLADALDAAHAQGIIHRDIKPSNIFVGDKNRVKILDFGLAKLSQPAQPSSGTTTRRLDVSTQLDLTMPGSALGTVSYMSPEQARGDEVDTRTDLFSLGVVLYEMATGVQAFGGTTAAVVFDAILNRTPRPITHLNPHIPPRLEAVIATALEKDRALRHQHASDLEAELKRLRRDLESGSHVGVGESRTAVAPAIVDGRQPSGSAPPAPPPQAHQSSSWRYRIAGLALIVVAALGFYFWPRGTPVADSQASNSGLVEPVSNAEPAQTAPAQPTPATATPTVPEAAPRPVTPTGQAQGSAAAPTGRGTPLPPPVKPAPVELRPPPPQTASTAPQRTTAEPQPSAAPALPSTPAVSTPTPAIEGAKENARESAPAPAPVAATPAPEPVATPPAPRNNTPAASTPAAIPPSSPVESDDAVIRRVIQTYERAIETKSVDLYRSVRPGLSGAEEARLRDSFRQVDTQQVDITIEDVRIEGKTATVRISRRDTFMSSGRRQTQNSRQTLRFEKTAAGWIIAGIG
ncbi:MAG TPA: protein kinase [Vicinamibacterales bacterium]|nr:protein kinase [Vicinamibacterales bacterium]